jgi:hypothetical protein
VEYKSWLNVLRHHVKQLIRNQSSLTETQIDLYLRPLIREVPYFPVFLPKLAYEKDNTDSYVITVKASKVDKTLLDNTESVLTRGNRICAIIKVPYLHVSNQQLRLHCVTSQCLVLTTTSKEIFVKRMKEMRDQKAHERATRHCAAQALIDMWSLTVKESK